MSRYAKKTDRRPYEERSFSVRAVHRERADLHKLKKVTGATGVPRFVADSDSNGHADRTWACFLAQHAAAGDLGPVHVSSRPRSSRLGVSLEGY